MLTHLYIVSCLLSGNPSGLPALDRTGTIEFGTSNRRERTAKLILPLKFRTITIRSSARFSASFGVVGHGRY